MVDQWVAKFANLLQQDFPELRFSARAEERFMPLVEVVSPWQHKWQIGFRQWIRMGESTHPAQLRAVSW